MLRKPLALLAAISLVASPTLAQASARPLSLQPTVERAGAAPGDSRLTSDGEWIAPVIAAVIVLLGILTATGVIFDDGDRPRSP